MEVVDRLVYQFLDLVGLLHAIFNMDRLPYTQGTKGYLAAQAFLRGENDSHKIAADLKTSVKNVQNVKSVVKRLLSAESNSSLNSSLKPILHQGEGSPVNTSQTLPPPAATPSYREHVPAAAGNPDDSVNNEERSSFSEDSQEGNGRESLGNSRREEVNNVQGNRQFSEERRPSRDSQRESQGNNAGNSRMLGPDIREARADMRLVKDVQAESGMGGSSAMGGLMDQELAVQATPIVKKVILNPRTYLFYGYAVWPGWKERLIIMFDCL
jgi:hypothetical protein